MMQKYSVTDEDIGFISEKCVAVLGYGSQGRSQARNLRDSGISVIVGNRPGKSFDLAVSDGFSVMSVRDAVMRSDILAVFFPDESAADIYLKDIAPFLKEGQCLVFAHGFNIHYGFIVPPKFTDVVLVAPKGVGPMVRKLYEDGSGVPSLIAVHQDHTGRALNLALGFAAGIGSSRSAVLASTFRDETETDLFGEQAVICGGLPALIFAAYDTLVKAGYPPELAFSECAHEVKLVVDLIYEGGFSKMHDFVSKTAGYGGITRGARVIGDDSRKQMTTILNEIQSGEFAKEWMAEKRAGSKKYAGLVDQVKNSDIETTGAEFRGLLT
ncbi:ketol-acid reductoisomerase [Methanocorpusculum labreanum]|nr:ketol-acid reductoisomerase [Methanocorpusculum labreanum]